MSSQNWWHRLGLVVCIVASVGFVSGCAFNMDNLKASSQVKATQNDSEKEICGFTDFTWPLRMSLILTVLSIASNM